MEVIFRPIYCPPVPLLMGLAKGTTYPLNKLFCPLVILYFHILCFRCSGHKPHTILLPQMICLLNQVCVDGYEVKNRVTCIMMQQSSTYSLILNFSNSIQSLPGNTLMMITEMGGISFIWHETLKAS